MTTQPARKGLLHGLRWVLAANLIYFTASALLTLLLPKFTTPLQFGLWQLYQLYALYFGYVTLGYSDGLNLRLAGKRSADVSSRQLSSGLAYLVIGEALVFLVIAISVAAVSDSERSTLLRLAALGATFYIPRTVITVVFQSTGRVRHYSYSIVLERLALIAGIFVLVCLGHTHAVTLVYADVAAKFVGLVVSLFLGRDVFLRRATLVRDTWVTFLADCRSGMFVLLANLAAMLISGGVRLLIVNEWGPTVFGQVSLGFQFASLLMVAVNSIAISLLPNVRRRSTEEYGSIYSDLRGKLVPPLVLSLALAFPVMAFLRWWLPDYGLAVYFTALLFPLYVYETTNRAISAVFLKALRMERSLLYVNCVALATAMGMASLAVHVLSSLELAVLAMIVGLFVRALVSDFLVAKRLKIGVGKYWIGETSVVCSFLICIILGSSSQAIAAMVLIMLAYAVWLLKLRRTKRRQQDLDAVLESEALR